MAQFIVYAMTVSAIICLACHCCEIGLIAYGRPARAAWMAGLGLIAMLTLVTIFGIGPRFNTPGRAVAHQILRSTNATVTRLSPSLSSVRPAAMSMYDRVQQLDKVIIALWIFASASALVSLVILTFRARRLIENARALSIHGVPVKLTRNSGPALAGFLDYVILLPEWCLRLPERDQTLIIEHERSHANAHDPLLVWLAALAIAVFPWNAPLWYLMRRLRTSIELDCDARVLERGSDVHAYGSLLLTVGARSPSPALIASAFSEHASELQRRIRVMSGRTRIPDRGAVVLASITAVLLLGAAVRAPRPNAISQRLLQETGFVGLRDASETTKRAAGNRNVGAVTVWLTIKGITRLYYHTSSDVIGSRPQPDAMSGDSLNMRAPDFVTADSAGGDVRFISTEETPIFARAHAAPQRSQNAAPHFGNIVTPNGRTATKEELFAQNKLIGLKDIALSDTVATIARRAEPGAFEATGSSAIGLLVDENNRVIYHSRIDVPDGTTKLNMLEPRLFPDMGLVERSPYRVLARIVPRRPGGNVHVVVVFMKRPTYAPDSQ
jgi:beta-lactamase regulating signal transducer with metallopeptidase domain